MPYNSLRVGEKKEVIRKKDKRLDGFKTKGQERRWRQRTLGNRECLLNSLRRMSQMPFISMQLLKLHLIFHLLMVKQMTRKTPSVCVRCRHLFSWPFALNPQIAKFRLFAFHELTVSNYPQHTSGAWQYVDNVHLTTPCTLFRQCMLAP